MPFLKLSLTMVALATAFTAVVASEVVALDDRLTIALDPGHGGDDPGAEAVGLNEAALVLDFAQRLERVLEETGAFDVVLTRTDNQTNVPLDKRLTRARQGGAEVFLSLHADALPPESRQATGLTVYTLDDEDVARANARLIERHNDADVLSGVDLSDVGDDVREALVHLSRQSATPRSKALARSLITTFAAGDVAINNRPHRHGGFAVLKAADMPSVLIELGFLSNARDRARLLSDKWLEDTALAIRDGLMLWKTEDLVFREQVLR